MAANDKTNPNLDPKAPLAATRIFPHATGVPKIRKTVARTTALSAIIYREMSQKSKNCGGSNLSHAEALADPRGIENKYDKAHSIPCYTGTPGVTLKISGKFFIRNRLERMSTER